MVVCSTGTPKLYRGLHVNDVKGYVCFVLEFAHPPFSPPLPSVVEVSKQNRHSTFDTRILCAPVQMEMAQPLETRITLISF